MHGSIYIIFAVVAAPCPPLFYLVIGILANERIITSSPQSKSITKMTFQIFGTMPHYSKGVYKV